MGGEKERIEQKRWKRRSNQALEEQSESLRRTIQTIQHLLALVRTVTVSEGDKMQLNREREINAVDTISF